MIVSSFRLRQAFSSQQMQIGAPPLFYYRAVDVVNMSARNLPWRVSDDSLSVLTNKYWSTLVGGICKMKKLTSHPFNNTNRAMLSKFCLCNGPVSYTHL